jgi:segregation and condensation protein A
MSALPVVGLLLGGPRSPILGVSFLRPPDVPKKAHSGMTTTASQPNPGSAGVPGGAAAPYAVKLPAFEGPLDLLLHLIRLNEVEITDIPIARICEQYLEYLELLRELNLDVAGEYLLMAATLAWIKSRMLLPPDGSEDEDEGLDPRAELVARLLEYQRFKEASEELAARPWLGRDVFAARGPEPQPAPEGEREIEVGLFELVEALRRALRSAPTEGRAHEIETEPITVRERMIEVMRLLETRESVAFEEALADERRARSRALVVATFLAVLELTRLAALRIFQSVGEDCVPRGPIRLVRMGIADGDWKARIADVM